MAEETKQVADSEFAKPIRNTFKFTKPGDKIKGTLLEVGEFTGDYGTCKKFTVKAIDGFFHNPENNAKIVLNKGENYTFFGKKIFEDDMLQAKIGQMVLVEYIKDGMSKKFKKPFKEIVAKLGPMDPDAFAAPSSSELPF